MEIESVNNKITISASKSTNVQNEALSKKRNNVNKNADKNTNQDIMEKIKLDPEYRPTIAEKTVIDAIEHANKKLMGAQTEFEFSVHKETKQIMVKVINKETKEVIREIPPEKTLDMVAKMWELAGIMVDERR